MARGHRPGARKDRVRTCAPTATRGLTYKQGWFPDLDAAYAEVWAPSRDLAPSGVLPDQFFLTVAGAVPALHRLPNSPQPEIQTAAPYLGAK